MNPFDVRLAEIDDAPKLGAMLCALAAETESKCLDGGRAVAGTQRLLRDEKLGFYLVACRDEEVVGCVAVTREWSTWRDAFLWWIGDVYVVPSARGCGVWGAMFGALCERAESDDEFGGFRLYVEAGNERARRVYERDGFAAPPYVLMERKLGQVG